MTSAGGDWPALGPSSRPQPEAVVHVLFYHKNYSAQFVHVADRFARRHVWQWTFVGRPKGGPAWSNWRGTPRSRATAGTHAAHRRRVDVRDHLAPIPRTLVPSDTGVHQALT